MNGLPYYKAYPRDFIEGTIGMSFEIKGAYRLVLDLIYMQGGDLPDDPRYISGLLGCSVKKWNSIRKTLLQLGKIYVSGEFLRNYRADKELETLAKLQDKQRENGSKSKKNSNLENPRLNHTEPEPDILSLSSRERENDAIQAALDAWNALADRGGLSKAQKLTKSRRSQLAARLRDVGGQQGWGEALARVEDSPFLLGRVNGGSGSPFQATLDWLLKEANFVKLMEGNYAKRSNADATDGSGIAPTAKKASGSGQGASIASVLVKGKLRERD